MSEEICIQCGLTREKIMDGQYECNPTYPPYHFDHHKYEQKQCPHCGYTLILTGQGWICIKCDWHCPEDRLCN